MSVAASSSVETGKPGAFSAEALLMIYVIVALVLGWLGVNALLDAILDTRERDAAAVQGYLDTKPQGDEHHHEAAPALKTAPAPASAVKSKARAVPPAAKTPADRPGRGEAKKGETKGT